MIESIQKFAETVPDVVQVLVVMLVGAIPYLESHFAAVLGITLGLPVIIALVAGILGNLLCTVPLIMLADRVRTRAVAGKAPKQTTPKRQKVRKAFERFGVPGVSLLGPLVVPSQITAPALVSFGVPRATVILWQVIAISAWGTAFAILASLGIQVLGH